MIELKDGIDFHTFEASFKPEVWKRRRERESVTEWIERVSIKDSGWLEKAKFRENNSYWIESSFKISVAVLSFLRENKMEQETLEDLVGFELILNKQHDWKLSEIKKLELYLNEKLF